MVHVVGTVQKDALSHVSSSMQDAATRSRLQSKADLCLPQAALEAERTSSDDDTR
jgi:hypothetical protein